MKNCKYCNQELDEGSLICPHCGKDNGEAETFAAEPVEETVTETVEETAPVTEPAEETAEAPAEAETPAEAEPQVQTKKATPGKIALAVAAVVVLLAVLVALIMAGSNTAKPKQGEESAEETTQVTVEATIPEDGNPDDATCKGSYTVDDKDAMAAKDTVVATIDGYQLTNGQLQVYYWSAVNSFLSSEQGYYVMMYGGVNPEQPLDTQRCMLDETVTWQQYFLRQALHSWQTSCGLAGEAEKAGMEMSQESRAFLDGIEDYLKETADSFNITVDELMRRNVGSGAGVQEFADFQELYSQGGSYYSSQVSGMVPTQQELEAFFDEHADGYAESGVTKDGNFVDVRHILVMAKGEAQEDGTTTYPDGAWETCEQDAQAILDAWLAGEKTEESFAALANEKSEDPGSNSNGGLYEKVYQGQMVKSFDDWCFDESRKAGDTGLVKTEYGYHVMYFVGSAPQWSYFAEKDWKAEKIGQMLTTLVENYPMEVDYSKIVLGNLEKD